MAALFNHKNSIKEQAENSNLNTELFNESQLLHALIDNMPDFIFIKDRSSKFILANPKLASIHGLKSGNQMIGKTDHDYYPKELANKYYSNEQEVMSSGEPLIGHEEKALNEKGEEITVSTTKIPLKDKKGAVIGIVGIVRDISARKKAEIDLIEHAEQLQQVNALLEEKQEEIQQQAEELSAQTDNLSMVNLELQKLSIVASETDNVVIILDALGNFEWINKSFTNVYGVNLEEYIKEKGHNILEGSHNPHIREILEKCRKSKQTVRYQSEASDRNGNKIWTQSSLTPVIDDENNIVRYVAIDTDITALKTAQDIINQQKAELEEHGIQLEKANITKDKFFSIIAHDLKNPFHSILGFTDLMVKNFDSIDNDKKREYLGLTHDSSLYAYNLLENLLNWSRTQTDSIRYNPSRIELHACVHEIFHVQFASIEKKKIQFKNLVPEGTFANADKNMLQTVLRNLLSNAIKFTPENGRISVRAEKVDHKIVVSITDTGIGISKDQQKKLFDFGEFKTSAGTEGEQGTGLGLIICHEFIRKHGGELKFTSSKEKGSTFYFDIPAAREVN